MIYIFLATGFEEIEALTPLNLFRRAGMEVKTVGIGGTEIEGAHNIVVSADMADVDFNDYTPSAVILPGGMPGTKNLDTSPVVERVLDIAFETGAHIGAICAAPMILGKLGMLDGKEAVSYPGFEKYLTGAKLSDKRVVTDGNITTAVGMGASVEFALELISKLKSSDVANDIRAAIIAKE